MASFLPGLFTFGSGMIGSAAGQNHQVNPRLGNLQVADIHVAVPNRDQPQADRNRRGME
jgi:hypothetical protein